MCGCTARNIQGDVSIVVNRTAFHSAALTMVHSLGGFYSDRRPLPVWSEGCFYSSTYHALYGKLSSWNSTPTMLYMGNLHLGTLHVPACSVSQVSNSLTIGILFWTMTSPMLNLLLLSVTFDVFAIPNPSGPCQRPG